MHRPSTSCGAGLPSTSRATLIQARKAPNMLCPTSSRPNGLPANGLHSLAGGKSSASRDDSRIPAECTTEATRASVGPRWTSPSESSGLGISPLWRVHQSPSLACLQSWKDSAAAVKSLTATTKPPTTTLSRRSHQRARAVRELVLHLHLRLLFLDGAHPGLAPGPCSRVVEVDCWRRTTSPIL